MGRYPAVELDIGPLKDLTAWLGTPPVRLVQDWPPLQIKYLNEYLAKLDCLTVLRESHYIDRDYIADVAAFYSRCLHNYPNHCQRLHFFSRTFDRDTWKGWIRDAVGEKLGPIEQELNEAYLGYVVLRPLEGCPIGRTVLRTYPDRSARAGHHRSFGATKKYRANIGPFRLTVTGLPFQQQDQGVSACATTALWTSLQKVAPMERRSSPTPAEITEAASRYLLLTGRALPSGGLGIQQMCEAIRGSGFEPVLVGSVDVSSDKSQLLAYLRSGFAPVLCVNGLNASNVGHAVCLAGVELSETTPAKADPAIVFRELSDSITGLYLHDDRLGPYARADIGPHTMPDGVIATCITIRGPGENEDVYEQSRLSFVVIPVPEKIRLNVHRILEVGRLLAQMAGSVLKNRNSPILLSAKYVLSTDYKLSATDFGLSEDANFRLQCGLALPRYLAVAEIYLGNEPLVDLLLDSTETEPNPAQLALVLRSHSLSTPDIEEIFNVAEILGANFLA